MFENLGPLALRESVLFGGLTEFLGQITDNSFVGFADDVPAVAFGFQRVSYLNDTNLVWFIGTELVHKYTFTFVSHCKDFIRRAKESKIELVAIVSPEFPQSQRWLRWMGFADVETLNIQTSEGLKPYVKMELK